MVIIHHKVLKNPNIATCQKSQVQIMNIIEVNSTEHKKSFLDFPSQLYIQDREFIRHLDNDIESVFDSSKNRYLGFGEAKRWLLIKDEKVIGKIAAFYHKENAEEPFSGIGFFDCINSQEAANLLFTTATEWLKRKGFSFALGPVNFGERDSFWGLMVSGFKNPSYRENYNPPYYQELFENFGFKKKIEQTTSAITRADFNYDRFSKLASRVFANPRYEFRHLKKQELDKFADDFVTIYNKAWQIHENYRPLTKDRIKTQMKEMMPIAPEEFNWFVYADGQPAGFYINVLNINPIFKKSNGKFDLMTKFRFLFNKSKIDKVRGIVFGVIPEFHNLGLEVGLIMKLYEQVHKPKYKHIKSSELAWVGDFNPKMLSMFESMGARVVKTHYTYKWNSEA